MSHPAPSRALARFRILDLTRVRAGPTCVRQFADFGADVIKIESPPGVDPNEGMGGARDGTWQRLCKAIEREDLLARPEFTGNANRAKHRIALNAELNATLAGRASAEWIEILNRAGVPCGPIYSVDQVFADPQVAHLQAAVEVEHPRLGKFRVLNQAARLSRTSAAIVSATPEIGQHTDEVLGELGYSVDEIAALHARGAV